MPTGSRSVVVAMAAVNRRRQLLLLLLLCRHRRRRRRQKRMWVRKIFQSRSKKGEFHALIAEMTLVDHESFYKYFHMTPQRFSQLLSCVGPFIKRQNTRLCEAIPPDERLALTLRYLVTGDSIFNRSALKYTPSFLTCNVKVEQNSSPYVTLISITCRATRECECPYVTLRSTYVTLRSTYVTLSDQCESAFSPTNFYITVFNSAAA